MSPTGVQVNKHFLLALLIGGTVVFYLWYRLSFPKADIEMDAVDKAKLSIDSVTIHHDAKLTFKVGDKDVTIAYREVKPGSSKGDILFLHGMKFTSKTWMLPPVKTLQLMYNLNYHSVAIDFPGFGESPKAEVDEKQFMEAVISKLKLDRPVIVSPSMSGLYALPFLLIDPATADKRCRGYVPVAPMNTELYKPEQYQQLKFCSDFTIGGLERIFCSTVEEIPGGLIGVLSAPMLFKVKTMIIYGAQDTGLGFTSRDNLKNTPLHEIVELPEAGHACYFDKPDAFHKNLHAFLESLNNN